MSACLRGNRVNSQITWQTTQTLATPQSSPGPLHGFSSQHQFTHASLIEKGLCYTEHALYELLNMLMCPHSQ